jgi:hypothetical protein
MQKHIGTTQSAYVAKKLKHLKSAGFEEGAYKLQFTIPNIEQLERLIDASLGKQVGVNVESMQGSVVRFGLSSPLPALAASTAVLSIMQVVPDGQGRVSFRKKSTGLTYSFPADLYRGVINSLLPLERQRIRIDAHFLEIIIQSKGNAPATQQAMEVTMSLQLTKPVEIEDLLKAFNAFQMLRNPKGLDFGMDFFDLQTSFGLNTSDSFDDCSYQIDVMKMIVDIKRHFEWSDPILLTLEEIEPQVTNLARIHPLFLNKLDEVMLSYQAGDNPPIGVEGDFLYVAGLRLGRYLFVEVLVITGVAEKLSDGSEKINGKIKDGIFKSVYQSSEDIEKIKADIEYAAHNYESDLPVFSFAPVFYRKALSIAFEEPAGTEATNSLTASS